MRSRVVFPAVAALLLLACSITVNAQTTTAPAPVTTTPDLSGIWSQPIRPDASGIFSNDASGVPFFGFTKQEPPMQPPALEIYKANRQGVKDARAKGRDESDPVSSCFPPGPTRILTDARPFEIRQSADVVHIFSETDHWVRRIYLNDQGPPDGYPVTWLGYSNGKYEGDALVAETTGINENTWIDSLGHPHSEGLLVVQRFRRVNHDTLEITFTFSDPTFYSKPWNGKKTYRLQRPGSDFKEVVLCEQYRKMGLRKGWEFVKE